MIEIDTPGHTASIAESHPDLVAGFERSPWQTYSGQPPAGQLRFASKGAVELTKEIFGSTLDLVESKYFGTGGDEVNEACMVSSTPSFPSHSKLHYICHAAMDGRSHCYFTVGWVAYGTVQLEDKETAAALKAKGWSLEDAINDYTGKTHATILNRHKIPVVWQEMVSPCLYPYPVDIRSLARLYQALIGARSSIMETWPT